MTTITGTAKDASGAGVVGVTVTARLVASSEQLTAGGQVIRAATTVTAAGGTWTLTLTPITALAYPIGAYYRLEADGRRWTITVPPTGSYELGSVLMVPPDSRTAIIPDVTALATRVTNVEVVDAAATVGSLRTLGTGPLQATAGSDTRLSDARTPLAHVGTHQPGGTDALAVDAAAGVGSLRTLGTGALQATAGNDARLGNARTPTAHAATHASAGADPVTVAESQVTNLVADLAAKAPTTRTITAGTGLTGGGDLSANRTMAVVFGTTAGTVAQAEPQVINVAQVSGFDRTGTTTSDAAFATLLASATAANPLLLYFPPGTYRFDTPWGVIDPAKVRIQGAGEFHTNINMANLTTGPAISVQKATAENRKHVVLSDLSLVGPLAPATTVDCVSLGGATTYANQCVFERVRVEGFRDQMVVGSNTWCIDWVNCYLNKAQRYGFVSAGTLTNSGEGLRFIGGTIAASVVDCVYVSSGATVDIIGVSLDFANHLITVAGGSRVMASHCHFECDDAQTGDSMITLQKDQSYSSHINISESNLHPGYTTVGTIKTFVRVTGAGGTINDQSVVVIDKLSVISGNVGITALVVDSSTASTSVAASKESSIVVRGLSYRDAGGSVGSLYPWYVQDRAGRKHLLSPGIDYGNVSYDLLHRASAWTHTVAHVLESVPRHLAVDVLAPASGDLYVIKLPVTGGDGFRSATSSLYLALGAAASGGITTSVGLYDLGAESGLSDTLTKVLSAGTGFGTPNVLTSLNIGQAIPVMYPRTQLFAAVLFVGGTSPELYGMKTAVASPLLDPVSTVFPLTVGRLTGQTAMPATIAVSTLTKSNFVPWFAFKANTYA